MPWDLLGNWVDDPTRAPNQQQNQAEFAGNPWGQTGLQNAEQTLMHHIQAHVAALQQQGQGTAGGQGQAAGLGGGYNDYLRYAPQQRQQQMPNNPDDFVELLNEFNNAFRFGIREVVVDRHTYAVLCAHFNTNGNHLRIATAGGNLTIMPEGARMPTGDDFDRYMEDVDGNAP